MKQEPFPPFQDRINLVGEAIREASMTAEERQKALELETMLQTLEKRRIPLTGIPEDRFPMPLMDVFNVRPDGYEQRLPMLEVAVRHYKPDLVILDGVRDLVADINDGVVAQNCIKRLMHLASEVRCCIVCILHQNKSAEDRNLRGWIGTELKNKAFEVYECSKSSERIFMWGQTDTRKYGWQEDAGAHQSRLCASQGKRQDHPRPAEVKASSPIRTSLYEREGSIWAD